MNKKSIAPGCICILLLLILVQPVCAIVEKIEIPASIDPLDRDRPENIAALKLHIAYIGGSQEARMDGIVSYIDTIGGSAGTGRLREIQTDYMAAASSIPLMNTSDRIMDLRDDMCVQSGLFAEETRSRMLLFNGSPEGMRERVNISLNAFDISLRTGPLWLADTTARITVFDRESRERNFTLRNLKNEGFAIADAVIISNRIDAKRPDLERAARMNSGEKISAINTEIKGLNRQFRNAVAVLRSGRMTG